MFVVPAWIAGVVGGWGTLLGIVTWYAQAYYPDPSGKGAGVLITPSGDLTRVVVIIIVCYWLPAIGLGLGGLFNRRQ